MSAILWGSSDSEPGTFERRIHDAFVPWVIKHIPAMARLGFKSFGPCSLFVIAESADAKARVLAVVVFNNYRPECRAVEGTIASVSRMWARPHVIRAIMNYVFNTLRCERFQATTARRGAGPRHTRRFLEHLGFKYEGVGRRGFGFDDAVMFSMLREDAARWLTTASEQKAA